MISEAEFDQYLAHLNAQLDPLTGRPELFCAHCGGRIGEAAAFVPGIDLETSEDVLNVLHLDCEAPWRAECEAGVN